MLAGPEAYASLNTSPAISAAATSCIAGIAYEQVSSVIEMVAHPRRSETFPSLGTSPRRKECAPATCAAPTQA